MLTVNRTMDNWEMILDADNFRKARALLAEIARVAGTETDTGKEIGLGNNASGELLFLCEYLPDTFDPEAAVAAILEALAATPDLRGSLNKGLAGVGLALKTVHDRFDLLDDGMLDELYGYVRQFVAHDIRQGNYDYLSGYLGQCLFLLEDDTRPENRDTMNAAIEHLQQIAVPQSTGVGWISDYELRTFYKSDDVLIRRPKDCNLGVSHGSAGIILVLSKISRKYPDLPLKGLLDAATAFLLTEESEENHTRYGYYYRGYSGGLGLEYPGRLAWCYCDLGISLLYFHLWETTGDRQYRDRADRIAQSCAQKTLENTPVNSGGLCHGFAGFAHLFNKIYQKTRNDMYRDAANYWFSTLFDTLHLDTPDGAQLRIPAPGSEKTEQIPVGSGLLDGLAGIGLSLHTATSNRPPVWDKFLLV